MPSSLTGSSPLDLGGQPLELQRARRIALRWIGAAAESRRARPLGVLDHAAGCLRPAMPAADRPELLRRDAPAPGWRAMLSP